MQPYKPFLIAPFKTGLDTDLEPWLVPQDAFTEITNAHIHHGYIQRRGGYRFLAQMAHGQLISAASNLNPAVFTVGSTADYTTGDTVTLHYLSGGTSWSDLNEIKYIITVASGTTFTLTTLAGAAVSGIGRGAYTANSGRVGSFPGLRIMGINRYITSDNVRKTLVSDTRRVAVYDSSNRIFDPLDLYDVTGTLQPDNNVFSSDDSGYIWAVNWQNPGLNNRVYLTNGKAYQAGAPGTDGIVYYDSTNRGTPSVPNVVQFQPSLGGSNLLYGAKMMFTMRQRLICLYVYEYNGATTVTYPQRASWSAAQDPSNWDYTMGAAGGGFVDAPTGEQIVSAQLLQDVIIVEFTDSVWTLRPVPDPALPLRWDRINSFRSCDGRMATTAFDRYVFALGNRGITATDGVETRRVDERIQDLTTSEINADYFYKVFAERDYANRRTWALYPDGTSTDCDKALIYDDESSAYSKYTIGMNVLGYGATSIDYAAQDFVAANNLDWAARDARDETAESFYWSQNSEIFLGGDTSGNVYVMETSNTDNGANVDFELKSAGWNPFAPEGVECQFGYLDLYLDSDERTRMNIQFYKNDNEDDYASQKISLLPDLNFLADVSDITINSDPTTGFVITQTGAGLATGNEFYVYGVVGQDWINDRKWTVGATVTANTLSVDTDITSFGSAITGITQANPAVVTAAAHGFSDGDIIYIVDVSGMTEVNNLQYTVANSTTNTFELQGVDSSAFTAYSTGGYAFYDYLSGGQMTELKFYRTKVWKRAYGGGIGYLHSVKITSEGAQRPFKIHAFKPWFKPRGRRTLG